MFKQNKRENNTKKIISLCLSFKQTKNNNNLMNINKNKKEHKHLKANKKMKKKTMTMKTNIWKFGEDTRENKATYQNSKKVKYMYECIYMKTETDIHVYFYIITLENLAQQLDCELFGAWASVCVAFCTFVCIVFVSCNVKICLCLYMCVSVLCHWLCRSLSLRFHYKCQSLKQYKHDILVKCLV